ncbi:cell wall lytic activity [Cerasibacillus terrae]|uniref:Cell wall lytic activity n=1 Tax=Cerasibacillus terrae TaxID=2498845 RepID=A0A5C8P3H5_9BACI|nr:NlpC/P60 family protein [Cerasibacillus terrae]TXL67817.1 cell wall lytic activity [Cerasibacillus terrae]
MNETLKHAVKHSFMYGMILSQPFAAQPDTLYDLLRENETLQYGEHSKLVSTLQLKLKKLSYYEDNVDGDFGILTEHALKQFQKENNISITGHTDTETLFSIIRAERRQNLKKIEQLSEKIYPGLTSENVKLTQEILQYFGYYAGEADGIYGPLTAQAIKVAEEEHNITLENEVPQQPLKKVHADNEKKATKKEEKINNEHQLKVKEKQDKEENENKTKTVPTDPAPSTDVIQTARAQIGTPYKWGGTSPGGFDCSGFLQFVYQAEDIQIPRTVSDIWNYGTPVEQPSVGDLIFFETYKPGPSHAGIYLGDGKFIHAGESRGVEISEMDNPYWSPKYLGAKRIEN